MQWKCPRCRERLFEEVDSCPKCGLVGHGADYDRAVDGFLREIRAESAAEDARVLRVFRPVVTVLLALAWFALFCMLKECGL